MSDPYLAEIKIVGFNFAPRGWAFCDGQILPINQNQALYSLLGTTYGGDGRTTFALPDLRGRTPIHMGTGSGLTQRNLGSRSGEERHSLTVNEIPSHTHVARASSVSGDAPVPTGNVLAAANNAYGPPNNLTPLHAGSLAASGAGQGHENMQPYLTLSFCIALQGLFPSRN
jgi:microcystin-dependent protein